MQKWEFLSVTIESSAGGGLFSKMAVVSFINGRELQNWKKGQNAFDYFQTLGEQGWELVAVNQDNLSGNWHFKRPKP